MEREFEHPYLPTPIMEKELIEMCTGSVTDIEDTITYYYEPSELNTHLWKFISDKLKKEFMEDFEFEEPKYVEQVGETKYEENERDFMQQVDISVVDTDKK